MTPQASEVAAGRGSRVVGGGRANDVGDAERLVPVVDRARQQRVDNHGAWEIAPPDVDEEKEEDEDDERPASSEMLGLNLVKNTSAPPYASIKLWLSNLLLAHCTVFTPSTSLVYVTTLDGMNGSIGSYLISPSIFSANVGSVRGRRGSRNLLSTVITCPLNPSEKMIPFPATPSLVLLTPSPVIGFPKVKVFCSTIGGGDVKLLNVVACSALLVAVIPYFSIIPSHKLKTPTSTLLFFMFQKLYTTQCSEMTTGTNFPWSIELVVDGAPSK